MKKEINISEVNMDLNLADDVLKIEDLLEKEDIELLKKYGIDQHFFDCFSTGSISGADFGDLPHIVKKAKITGIINQTMSIDSLEKLDIVRLSDDSLASCIILIEVGIDVTLSDLREILQKIRKQMDIDGDIIYILDKLPTDNEIKVSGFFYIF